MADEPPQPTTTQHSSGAHALLSMAWVYRTYQRSIGAHHLWRTVIAELSLPPGGRLLDIGCGPGDVVAYLGDVEYVGIDFSQEYIDRATQRYGEDHTFLCADITTLDAASLGRFDAVLAHGVLHHVTDEIGRAVFELASEVLHEGGRVTTVDPAYAPDQSWVVRFLLDHDRGKRIRTAADYAALANGTFDDVDVRLEHRLLRIPYTLAIVNATRARTT
jgi:SAM-dependent methyltransferase